ncbi:sucrose-6-phosphate hydrolase SacC (GH32 family) [Kitasatospora herbaricolor]|uniref:GH32 C-terminal domain-containing protein n=1 Tax=Kitasatospora herbaricolor TaxID=68217 RepID=UPI002791C765|nr:GH32 C-terminal domain-containing protein [Kitasatospora herbaricolor]MDQ0306795.1 sucrose-6-phosphate hydrolase SacC (GH32 family) [Kitasatospora herbaricolor]
MRDRTVTHHRSKRLLALSASAVLGLALLAPSADAQTSYTETYRPQLHFSPAQNWMNDPNGPIWYKGTYHLFFQYNPSGNTWGNMSWGHATSPDLVHWTEQPIALPQDANEMVFSGGVVLDKNNTTGFGTSTNPPLVAIYTSYHKSDGVQAQSLAYSTDGGTTWTKYAGNPVLNIGSQNFRDPKVFWNAQTNSWLMTVALSADHKVSFYSSPNLKTWTKLSDFGPAGATGGLWECPDLFQLPVDGDPSHTKWVLVVNINPGGPQNTSAAQYFVGDFDGTTFTPDGPATSTPPAGTVLADFEGSTYGSWATTGAAFGTGPAQGTLPGQQSVSGYLGKGLVNSFLQGDSITGTLTSPAFTVDKPYLNFLVGGGNHPNSQPNPTTVNLVVDGAVVRTVTGKDNEALDPVQWDLRSVAGKQARIQIVDNNTGGWGHINADQFTLTDQGPNVLADFEGSTYGAWATTGAAFGTGPAQGTLANQNQVTGYLGKGLVNSFLQGDSITGTLTSPAFTVDKPYLNFLVGGGNHPNSQASPTAVNLVVDGAVVRTVTGKDNEALDPVQWDLRSVAGKQARIQIVDNNSGGWGHINADQFTLTDEPVQNQASNVHWMDYGADFYAATSFNDEPAGRRVVIGWMNNWQYGGNIPTSPWRSADSLPRELSLKTVNGALQLVQVPIKELEQLRTGTVSTAPTTAVAAGAAVPLNTQGSLLDITATLRAGTANDFGLKVHTGGGQETRIGYDTTTQELYVDRTRSGDSSFGGNFAAVHRAPLSLDADGKLQLRVVVDTSSVEVYAADGQVVLTDQIFPNPSNNGVSAYATGGSASLDAFSAQELNSIWANR